MSVRRDQCHPQRLVDGRALDQTCCVVRDCARRDGSSHEIGVKDTDAEP